MMGISKTITLTNTYDHRVIQGAESGLFLARIHEFLKGEHEFYDSMFASLDLHYPPLRWAEDHNPTLFGAPSEQAEKQANVLQLIDAYRSRGHLLADIDPLNMTSHVASDLELENFGLTIWDLDREFITGGLHGEDTATLRRVLEILRRAYAGKVGIEYRHIRSSKAKEWIRRQIREHFVSCTRNTSGRSVFRSKARRRSSPFSISCSKAHRPAALKRSIWEWLIAAV